MGRNRWCLLLALAACGEPQPMLHQLQRFAGDVELSGTGGGSIAGRLAFDRDDDHLQFQLREPEPVSLVRDAAGELRAFAGDRWRTPSSREREVFRFVAAVVGHRPDIGDVPMRSGDGYRITVDGQQIGVRVLERTDPHRDR